jgi:hypothetical protein
MAMGAARDTTEADLLLTRVSRDKTGANERGSRSKSEPDELGADRGLGESAVDR